MTSKSEGSKLLFFPKFRGGTGIYTISLRIPGCGQSCENRGEFIAELFLSSGQDAPIIFSAIQNKKDDFLFELFAGIIPGATPNFIPRIQITPKNGMTISIDSLKVIRKTSLKDLNGLVSFNDKLAADIQSLDNIRPVWRSLARADSNLDRERLFAIDVFDAKSYVVGGSFSGSIKKIDSGTLSVESLPNGGLDGPVFTLSHSAEQILVGGTFTSTTDRSISLSNVAMFNLIRNSWEPLMEVGL